MAAKSWNEIASECIDIVKRIGEAREDCCVEIGDPGLDGDFARVYASVKRSHNYIFPSIPTNRNT